MKKSKKVIILAIFILMVTSFTAFAASRYNTPTEALADITGKGLENVLNKRYESEISYSEIAYEKGNLEEFQEEMLEMRKDNLQAAVERGQFTQEEADMVIKQMEERYNSYEEGSFGRHEHMGGYGHSGYDPRTCHGFRW